MEEYIENLTGRKPGESEASPEHPCFQGYLQCFNQTEYYEAHDVLEHLWLQNEGPDRAFLKGLIQFAGAFVHLKLQANHSAHHVHRRRLKPALRLFQMSQANFLPFPANHWDLDLAGLVVLGQLYQNALMETHCTQNPWDPAWAPRLHLHQPLGPFSLGD